jgi:hypothetical protein
MVGISAAITNTVFQMFLVMANHPCLLLLDRHGVAQKRRELGHNSVIHRLSADLPMQALASDGSNGDRLPCYRGGGASRTPYEWL